jgi:phospholipid/cholesterol/gamma-HCH transport system substrate-binding protein
VEKIGLAPDGELIEVVMAIDSRFAKRMLADPTLRAQLQLSGITGLRYVEIDRHKGDALLKSPELSFKPPYPLIPSTPSQFKAVTEALQDIYNKVINVDLAGISADMRATLQAADQVLRDDRVQQILTHMSEMTASASRAASNVDQMTAGVRLGPVVADLRQTTDQAKQLIVELREGETGTDLRSALREIDGLARTTQSFVLDLQGVIDRLNHTADNLGQLTDLLRQQPSRLLFSEPPPPRGRPGGEQR